MQDYNFKLYINSIHLYIMLRKNELIYSYILYFLKPHK